MKKFLFAGLLATAFVMPAQADLVRFDSGAGGNAGSFVDLGGQGFGNFPRALTLQTKDSESGFGSPVDVANGDAISGANKTTTPTLSSLNWTTGGNVAIGFNADQEGHTGINLTALTLTIYNGTVAVASYSLAAPVSYTGTDLAMEPGNGNAVWAYVLDPTQRDAFTAAMFPGSYFAGLGATLTDSNDGPDSFILGSVVGGVPFGVPGPIVGAGLPGLIAGCGALVALARRRRQKLSLA